MSSTYITDFRVGDTVFINRCGICRDSLGHVKGNMEGGQYKIDEPYIIKRLHKYGDNTHIEVHGGTQHTDSKYFRNEINRLNRKYLLLI